MSKKMNPGIYDDLLNIFLQDRLKDLNDHRLSAVLSDVDPADVPHLVAQVVEHWVERSLNSFPAHKRLEAGISLSSQLMDSLYNIMPDAVLPGDALVDPLQRLIAIESVGPDGKPNPIEKPLTPIRDTVLMTNARGEPGVGRELLAEIASADRIDLVCAFIRWTGIREMLSALRRHVELGRELRVITTTYTGTTEARALEALQDLGGQVRVSYDTSTTRLHAKAWLFHRDNGHSTVYIGSSNLTFSAQVTGLEWNVRAAQQSNPALIDKFEATFSSYWANTSFERFDRDRFQSTLSKQIQEDIDLTPFDIQPYPFQRQILEKLQVDRDRGYPHNLVVAATGTGKTVVAALDYRVLKSQQPSTRLLYVAHRKEILQQSRATFRHVLRDGAFGELWVDGQRPQKWDHVFASIQTLNSNEYLSLSPNQFDIVVVDEFHHAAASTYEKFLDYIQPKHLLGLTATPERTDELDILRWFDGRISVELRLWDALEQELLVPFHYFGIHDGTDLSNITWRRGSGYDVTELTAVYTAENVWLAKILQAVKDKIGEPHRMRALGFCVSIDHANFMAQQFDKAGLKAKAITSHTPAPERKEALSELRDGLIQVIFTVDLFNEGVDIPAIDVVLMLRPTESATIFLQQLGRGLRRSEGKDVLTVLDFVGHQRREFRFDLRYRRMLGRSRRELIDDIKKGFPYLPAGCHLQLDNVAADIVLNSLQHSLPLTWQKRVQELKMLGDISLREYLLETGLDIQDIYRNNHYWTKVRRAAGFLNDETLAGEARVGRGLGRLLHVDDLERLEFLKSISSAKHLPNINDFDERKLRQFEMALVTIFNPNQGEFETLQDAIQALWTYPDLLFELTQILDVLDDQVIHDHKPLDVHESIPLLTHAHYSRDEILSAFGVSGVTEPPFIREGVYWHEPTQTDIFFITLKKSEKDFSPTTRYRDYAISETLFHWESQATTTVGGVVGQRYINHQKHGTRIALFIRPEKTDANGRTLPYLCAGLANYIEHESERPIAITWELETPLPGDLYVEYRAAVV